MIPFRRLFTRAASLLVLMPACYSESLPAQTPPSPPQDGKPTPVQFRIILVDPSDTPLPEYGMISEAGFTPVKLPVNSIAGPYKTHLRDHQHLDFHKENEEKPSISVKIPQDQHKDLLLVFIPKKEKGDCDVIPVHAPLKGIKGGTRLIVNTSKTEVSIKYGDAEPVVIPPLGTGVLPGPGGDKIVNLPVVISEKTDKGWRPFSTEYWPYDPRAREFLFIYRSERTKQLRFHGVTDRVDLDNSEEDS